jgi:hypothetical protein
VSEFIASLSFAAPWTRGLMSSLVGCTVSYSRQSTPGFIIDTFRHAGTGHPLGGIAVAGLSSPLVTAPNEIYSGVSAYAYERTAVIEEMRERPFRRTVDVPMRPAARCARRSAMPEPPAATYLQRQAERP